MSDTSATSEDRIPVCSNGDEAVVPSPPSSPRSLGLSSGDRAFLRLLLVVFLIVFAAEWIFVGLEKPQPPELQRGDHFAKQFRVEVNSATWIDWMQLEGIGPTLAHRIDADRKQNGPFRSIDDVGRVPGIGPAKLAKMRPWLVMNQAAAPTALDVTSSGDQ